MTIKKPYRVVVGIDFAEISEPAFAEAMKILRGKPGAELHVCHVVWESNAAKGDRVALDEQRIEDAQFRLVEWLDHRGRTFDPEAAAIHKIPHVLIGKPAQVLEQLAADVEADLIVVGTLGLRGVEKMFFGSVADELLRRGRVPVLVARRNRLSEIPKSPGSSPPLPETRS
jgi:nucleotide-binding universal stress UspA family protein